MLTSLFINDYKQHVAPYLKIAKTHLKGWSYVDWQVCGINNKNRHTYLSTRAYCSLHPLNDSYSFWIDDKLTLKYILSDTECDKYMPLYYYQINENDNILALPDLDKQKYGLSFEGIAQLLQDKQTLAFKLIKGSLGVGFYKAEYRQNKFYLNEQAFTKDEFITKIHSLKGYIITEYLFPNPEFARFCDKSVGCLRYTVGRMRDGSLKKIISFIRIGTKKSKFVENYAAGGVLSYIDNKGNYKGGNVIGENLQNISITHHPDNNIELNGTIPLWQEITKAVKLIADTLPQLSYLGIDFCVTNENKVKIIEINSLTSLDTIETLQSVYSTPSGDFFKERLKK